LMDRVGHSDPCACTQAEANSMAATKPPPIMGFMSPERRVLNFISLLLFD
jgi:hypothetical protein